MRHYEAAKLFSYPSGVHKLLPVSFSDSRVLQLVDGSKRGQQILHSRFQAHVDVPHPHLLIQHLHLLKCGKGIVLNYERHLLAIRNTSKSLIFCPYLLGSLSYFGESSELHVHLLNVDLFPWSFGPILYTGLAWREDSKHLNCDGNG